MWIKPLLLQRANQQPFYKIPLQEGIEQYHRPDCQYGGGHLHRFLRKCLGAEDGSTALHLLDHADFGVQLKQQVLQGIQPLVVHQHDGVEPVVPVSNAVEQRNRGQNGHTEREVDPERDIEVTRAVDFGRLRQGRRNLGHVVTYKKQVERVEHQGRNDQGPYGIIHAEIQVYQIPGHQTRVKYHRNEKEQSEPVAVTDMLGGQRISGHGRNGDRKDRADHGHEDRDQITSVQRRAAEQEQLVGIKR